ncbi:chemotaxis protein CheA [Sporolactobacillus shoreae]|uniref:Chemotaxis protein CheA n=1 Tax=Sporolactobacillus shoreae TaxID=1465501 RepID=A0A4Z0GTJ2_9BACL|nr:chemotaxis protein CheA [Sporolactobacillus shoreae]TGB00301.1 chemotaxis protein CheA [Sporolactobacillus shoreae]
MDMSQYLSVFIDEAREHLQNLNDKLMELEEKKEDPELINSIFRSAHTLKGSSGQMGFSTMMELTHTMENVFDALRHQKAVVSSNMVDVLLEALDLLESMVDSIEQGGNDKLDTAETLKKLRDLLQEKDQTVAESVGPTASRNESTASGLSYSEYDYAVVEQALSQNMSVFETEITLRKDCVLKAARALMVSNALEDIGNIVKSKPSTEDIEKEAFDRAFTYVVVTDRDEETVRKKVMDISEIEIVTLSSVKGSTEKNEENSETKDKKESPEIERKSQPQKPIAKTIRVNLDRLDHLLNLFEEMVIDRSRLEKISSSMENQDLKESVGMLKRVSDQLQETILNLRMEPVEQVFNRFPRMVRSLSKELDKKVNLVITGAETELDRTVIDEIGDPLMHMIRNSMDHGIEHPDVREKAGKNPEGTLALRAYHSGSHVFIEIEDDGAGINREKVLKKAVEKGIVSEDRLKTLTDKDIYHLLFESGFSTADKISDISGRGVGLDVVESKIHSLSGTVEVDSTPGKGTKFTVKLPLTLSIINAMLVQAGPEVYAIPIASIAETALEREVNVQTINQSRVMSFRERIVPLINLDDYLNVTDAFISGDSVNPENESSRSIVLVRQADKVVGVVADKLLGYQDIVIKPLGKYLKNVRGFSGATILGDGKVALILDCQELINAQKKKTLKQNA